MCSGRELNYMTINKLYCLQADLQAVKDYFCKNLQLLIIWFFKRQFFGRLDVVYGFLR